MKPSKLIQICLGRKSKASDFADSDLVCGRSLDGLLDPSLALRRHEGLAKGTTHFCDFLLGHQLPTEDGGDRDARILQ